MVWALLLMLGAAPSPDDLSVRAAVGLRHAATWGEAHAAVAGAWPEHVGAADGRRFSLAVELKPTQGTTRDTAAVGLALLRAFEATGEALYRQGALDAARALAAGQRACGGWAAALDLDPAAPIYTRRLAAAGQPRGTREAGVSFGATLTPAATLLLLRVGALTGDAEVLDAADHATFGLLQAQLANGAWPATWPLADGPAARPTLLGPDGAVTPAVIEALLAAAARWPRAKLAAARGGDFLLQCRLDGPAPGWPASTGMDLRTAGDDVSASATAAALTALAHLTQATGDTRFSQPAAAVLRGLPGGEPWPEHWHAAGGAAPADAPRADWGLGAARELALAVLRGRGIDNSREARAHRTAERAPRVAAMLDALDDQWRWKDGGEVLMARYAANLDLLALYLHEFEPLPEGLFDPAPRPQAHRN
jgi:hypothetical protein